MRYTGNYELPASSLIEAVNEAHRHTLECVAGLDDAQLTVPLEECVNPFRWELGHVAFFYDVFLLRILDGGDPIMAAGDDMYDSFKVAHDDRWGLPLPSQDETIAYTDQIRDLIVERLSRHEPDARETYLHLLALVHEDMHGEAFTYMRQTLGYAAPSFTIAEDGLSRSDIGEGPLAGDVAVPGGEFQLGATPDLPFVFDNEKWAHAVEVAPFEIARAPVTNAEFAEFVDDGGYQREDLWGYQGWVWRAKTGAQHPIYWRKGEKGWTRRNFDKMVPLEAHAPVIHVTWFEAMAYCNWAGRRLPSEAEWEMAASAEPSGGGDGTSERKRRYPWGDEAAMREHANLDSRNMGCVDVAAYPAGDSAFGCRQMIGNVWEWTATPFYPYPGYLIDYPYKEYSAPWFGYRYVLKGGAWATGNRFAYNTLRNFFDPHRNDIYSGFRTCAKQLNG